MSSASRTEEETGKIMPPSCSSAHESPSSTLCRKLAGLQLFSAWTRRDRWAVGSVPPCAPRPLPMEFHSPRSLLFPQPLVPTGLDNE